MILFLSAEELGKENEMSESGSISQEEIDLKKLILTLLNKWYILVIFTVIGAGSVFVYGLFNKYVPTYTATAVIHMADANLTEFILKEGNKDIVANKLGVDSKSVITLGLAQQANDKSLYNLTIQSTDKNKAIVQVNAWADVVVEEIINSIISGALEPIAKAQADVEAADKNLVEYIHQINLDSLLWSDLINITGVVINPNLIVNNENLAQPLVTYVISDAQRSQLAKLMREKIAAEQTYQNVSTANYRIIDELGSQDYFVVHHATWAKLENPVNTPYRNLVLGSLGGFLAAILLLWIILWWKS